MQNAECRMQNGGETIGNGKALSAECNSAFLFEEGGIRMDDGRS